MQFGGPLRGEDGRPKGRVIIFEAADLAAARAIAERDPYVTEGVFQSYELFETSRVFPRD